MKKPFRILGILFLLSCTVLYGTSVAFFGSDALLGSHRNANGIRDEMEVYINSRAPENSDQHRALKQLTMDYQKAFKVLDEPDLFKKACLAIRQSDDCVVAAFGNYDEIHELMSEQFDNLARSRAAVKINAEHFRSMKLLPEEDRKKCCDFINPGRAGCEDT